MSYHLDSAPSTLIRRRAGTNTHDLTPDQQRLVIFYTKVHDPLLGQLIAADEPPPQSNCEEPWPPSTATSPAMPAPRAWETPPTTRDERRRLATKDR
jgi:hypothetical protein